jgi:hypothetical protein
MDLPNHLLLSKLDQDSKKPALGAEDEHLQMSVVTVEGLVGDCPWAKDWTVEISISGAILSTIHLL